VNPEPPVPDERLVSFGRLLPWVLVIAPEEDVADDEVVDVLEESMACRRR
jgi:hypothetical protein